jgi:hypothetical protein
MKKLIFTFLMIALATAVSADDIAVTIYNSNLGVVSETRELKFEQGINRLAYRDVPSQIDANSVRFDLVNGDNSIGILEQNYAYDLVSSDQIYTRYIDKEIDLITKDGDLISGTLLSTSGGTIILMEKSGGVKIVMIANIAEVNFPSLPDGLITRPTLFWLYQSAKAGTFPTRVSYQTGGMTWAAEYVGVLNGTEDKLDMSGWAAIDNNSGKTFTDASLKLVAGDINRVQQPEIFLRGGRAAEMMYETDAKGFAEKAFFEYHLYTLPRKATLANREKKQISLFDPATTNVEKKYFYRPDRDAKAIDVAVVFTNSKSSGLGLPLPEGRVRLFKADDDGSLILLGEDQIDHTPTDEEVSLKVGNAFDIVGEQKIMNQQRISNKIEDQEFEIELRNHKKEAVKIEVEKKLYGFWDIRTADFEYDKKDANTVTAEVSVPADGAVTLKFTVRYSYR